MHYLKLTSALFIYAITQSCKLTRHINFTWHIKLKNKTQLHAFKSNKEVHVIHLEIPIQRLVLHQIKC